MFSPPRFTSSEEKKDPSNCMHLRYNCQRTVRDSRLAVDEMDSGQVGDHDFLKKQTNQIWQRDWLQPQTA
jgi:hypothetical protein